MLSDSFPKSCRLLKKKDFRGVLSKSERKIGKYLCIDIIQSEEGLNPRIGISVTKKFGKAHDRNRFKRLTREAFRLLKKNLKMPIDCLVRPKGKFPVTQNYLKMQDISADMRQLLSGYLRS